MSRNIEATIKKLALMTPEEFEKYSPQTKAEEIAKQVVSLATQGDKTAIQFVLESMRSGDNTKTQIKIVDK